MIWAGFLVGLVGSLHCLGMCGPIVLALPGSSGEKNHLLTERMLYNAGRAVTYGVMGALVGILGLTATLAGYQQVLGIAAGSLMILTVIIPQRIVDRVLLKLGMGPLLDSLKRGLGRLLAKGSVSSLFVIGLLNGLLPCGLVYTALAGSLAAGGIWGSVLFMVLFGLGTFPLMFAASYATGLVTASLRKRIQRIVPYGVVLLGILFILRGLSLGIPFISPKMEKMLKGKPVAVNTIQVESDLDPVFRTVS